MYEHELQSTKAKLTTGQLRPNKKLVVCRYLGKVAATRATMLSICTFVSVVSLNLCHFDPQNTSPHNMIGNRQTATTFIYKRKHPNTHTHQIFYNFFIRT